MKSMHKLEYLNIFYTGLTVGVLLTIKYFLFESCFSFDTNDDVNHTFVNLHATKQAISIGELPRINLFNNFGTPLIGDALTYPFAIHSLSYWFLDYPVAMTLNRAIIAFSTTVVLSVFFRNFFSNWISIICALLVIMSPGVLWNLAHHHYQATLLIFTLILLIHHNTNMSKRTIFSLLTLSYIVFFLSVSIHVVAISIPFLLLYPILQKQIHSQKRLALNLSSFLIALVGTFPFNQEFFKLISQSIRLSYSPYSGLLPTIREQLLGLLVPPGEWMYFGINGHFGITTYYSILTLTCIIFGVSFILRHAKIQRRLLLLVILLGIAPTLMAFWLQFYGNQIPLISSVDSTRVWWFSNIFLFLSIGYFLEELTQKANIKQFPFVLILFCSILFFFYLTASIFVPEFQNISYWHLVILLIPSFAICVLTMIYFIFSRGKSLFLGREISFNRFGALAISFSLILTTIPTLVTVLGLNMRSCEIGNHFFAKPQNATFQPYSFLDKMEEHSRFASAISPHKGYDLKSIFGNVMGSNSRSIISSAKFRDILLEHNLIKESDNYFFSKPWQVDKLTSLGIRYLLTSGRDLDLEKQGWKILIKEKGLDGLYLYENPEKPTLVKLKDGSVWKNVQDFIVQPNGLTINLPKLEEKTKIQISLNALEGWRYEIDNEIVTNSVTDLGMMELEVSPGAKNVKIFYAGNYLFYWYFWSIAALITFSLVIIYLSNKRGFYGKRSR